MRRALPALLLVAAWVLPSGWAPVRAEGERPALIHGIIYRGDEVSRLAGALVTAINVKTGRRYSSLHTGANGAYEISGLPAGTYDIAIDTPDENLYVTDGLIDLQENQRLLLSLSLKHKGGVAPGAPSPGTATPAITEPGTAPPASSLASPGAGPEGGQAPEPDATKSKSSEKSKSSGKKPKKSGSKPSTGSGATAMLRSPELQTVTS
jgi:hypothetical protein